MNLGQPDSATIAAELSLGKWPRIGMRIATTAPISDAPVEVRMSGIAYLGQEEVPVGFTFPLLSVAPDHFREWRGYQFDLFGTLVSEVPTGVTWPFWRMSDATTGNPEYTIRLWRQWAFYEDSPVYAEVLWLPGYEMQRSIKGLEHANRRKDIDAALVGLRLLSAIEHIDQVRGGQKGESQEEARLRILLAIRQLAEEDRKVSTAALSEVLVLSVEAVDKLKQRAGWFRRDLEREWVHEYRKLQLRR